MMPWHHEWGPGSGWVLMLVFMLLLWTVLIGAFLVTVYATRRPLGGAADVLAERFARGEIDAGEYERRRALLQRSA
jgi:putative membrane protein